MTPDERLDAWLTRNLNDLNDSVAEQLDIDAGLRDAQLPDRAAHLDAAVHSVLDVDAGLAAVVSAQRNEKQPVVHDLREIPEHTRLAARETIPFEELGLVLQIARTYRELNLVQLFCSGPLDTRPVVSAVYEPLWACRKLAADLPPRYPLLRDTFLVPLNHAIDLLEKAQLERLVADLPIQVGMALDGVLKYTIKLIWSTPWLEPSVAIAMKRELDPLLGARSEAELRNVITTITGIIDAFTDFTDADLSGLEVRSLNELRGIRWSTETTRWPPGWQNVILDASVQLDPTLRPDLYEVRRDPRPRLSVAR